MNFGKGSILDLIAGCRGYCFFKEEMKESERTFIVIQVQNLKAAPDVSSERLELNSCALCVPRLIALSV